MSAAARKLDKPHLRGQWMAVANGQDLAVRATKRDAQRTAALFLEYEEAPFKCCRGRVSFWSCAVVIASPVGLEDVVSHKCYCCGETQTLKVLR